MNKSRISRIVALICWIAAFNAFCFGSNYSSMKLNNGIIAFELMNLNKNDSVVLLVPEHACLHVSPELIVKEPKWKYCDSVSRFNGIPVRQRQKLHLGFFRNRMMRNIIDSIGAEQRMLAACSELRGVILGFKSDSVKIFKFDACNGYVDYVNQNFIEKSNLKPNSFDQILKMFHANDHFWPDASAK